MTALYLNDQNDFDLDNALSLKTEATASKRSNALATKLTTILSSSYADSELHDALRQLDSRGAQNAEQTRVTLKFDAQKEVIDANAHILEDFGKVAKQLQRIGGLITVLNQTCDSMRNHIVAANQESAPVLEEAATLLARKQETESKQALLDAFKIHFLLSDDDLTTLTSSAQPVNDEFFVVLARVRSIYKDCQILLGHENQRVGLELMEQTSRHLDAGYKKLYNWIQREFKELDLEDSRTNGSIRRSLRALSDRPTLFQNCLDLFAEAREGTLSVAFQKALTDSIGAKAIDFSTHDPLRYIGDMLAWVHSAAVSEKEALEGLFISDADEISRSLTAGKEADPWSRVGRINGRSDENGTVEDEDEAFDGQAALASLVGRNLSSVAQTLSHRTSLSIRNFSDALSVYKSYNMLLYYEGTFSKLLKTRTQLAPGQQDKDDVSKQQAGHNQNLLDVISQLQSQALTVFSSSIQSDLEAESGEAPDDLQSPEILTTNLSLISAILHLRAPNLTDHEFSRLYQTTIAPVLRHCASIADELATQEPLGVSTLKTRPDFQAIVYQLNYLSLIETTFTSLARDKMLNEFVSKPLREVQHRLAALGTQLTDTMSTEFLSVSSIHRLWTGLKHHRDPALALPRDSQPSQGNPEGTDTEPDAGASREVSGQVIPDLQAWLITHLPTFSSDLDTFLSNAIMDTSDDLSALTDKSLAKTAITDAADRFCSRFEEVVRMINVIDDQTREKLASMGSGLGTGSNGGGQGTTEADADADADAGDGEVASVFLEDLYPRTVEEVRALLS